MREQSATVPYWVMVLEAAKEWGVPPWLLEEQMTQRWWDRWRLVREETVRLQNKPGEVTDG